MAEQAAENQGVVSMPSRFTVDETVQRLEAVLAKNGIKLFALIDHSGEAAAAGMKMPATKLAIFGSPKSGTPLMLASPGAAIDLPLKILIAEDNSGSVWVSYNAPAYLASRHGLPPELLPNVSVIEKLAAAIVG